MAGSADCRLAVNRRGHDDRPRWEFRILPRRSCSAAVPVIPSGGGSGSDLGGGARRPQWRQIPSVRLPAVLDGGSFGPVVLSGCGSGLTLVGAPAAAEDPTCVASAPTSSGGRRRRWAPAEWDATGKASRGALGSEERPRCMERSVGKACAAQRQFATVTSEGNRGGCGVRLWALFH